MENKPKILYIEDMKECYEKTKEALGSEFDIVWRDNCFDAIKTITRYLKEYSAAIFDVNLTYNPELPQDRQTTEGLTLIKILKKECQRQGVNIPIICASSNGELYKHLSEQAGADKFLWKKELWEEKGKEILENLVKKV